MTRGTDARRTVSARILALGGVTAPLLFAAVVVVAGRIRPGYSHRAQFISELGATGTPMAGLMNYVGFIPTGVMLLAFAASTRRLAPGDVRASAGTLLLCLFAGAVGVAGVVRCDVGCPVATGSWPNLLHGLGSAVAFSCAIVALELFGRALRDRAGWERWGRYSAIAARVALLTALPLTLSLISREWTGLWQRLLLASLFIWFFATGWRLFRRSRSGPGRDI